MFNFVSDTYSALLSILTALFSLSYPLIIGCIEKIDSRYKSTLLTKRFEDEKSFGWFKILLVINLTIAIILPFILNILQHPDYFIAIQTVGCIILCACTIQLLSKIIFYYNIEKLQKEILKDYNLAESEKDKAKYFNQWIDITPQLLSSTDYDLVGTIYNEIEKYIHDFIAKQTESSQKGPYTFDLYFYAGITRINENLCTNKYNQYKLNNKTNILTTFISDGVNISDMTYRYLWRNIQIQLFYNKDEWLLKYWEIESSNFSLSKYDLFSGVSQEARNKFLEFNIMVCALVMKQGKYSTLQQMLNLTTSNLGTYPLVPSNLAEILNAFFNLEQKYADDFTYLGRKYTMPQMYGIKDDMILGTAFKYLALLVYRLYTIPTYSGNITSVCLPLNLKDLAKYKEGIETLSRWISSLKNGPEIKNVLNINNNDELMKNSSISESPEELLEGLKIQIKHQQETQKENQPLSKEKIETLKENILNKVRVILQLNKIFSNKTNGKNAQTYTLRSFDVESYPNEAFLDDPSISYVDIDSRISGNLLKKFYDSFVSAFYMHSLNKSVIYNISSKKILKAIDNLNLSKEKHVIVSFGIYWGHILGEDYKIDPTNSYRQSYKDIEIADIPCSGNAPINQSIFIINKEDKPYFFFQKPSQENIHTYALQNIYQGSESSEDINCWMSVIKASETSKDFKTIHADTDFTSSQNSFLTVYWDPILQFKKDMPMVCFHIKYQGSDEGTCIDINEIKQFPSDKE